MRWRARWAMLGSAIAACFVLGALALVHWVRVCEHVEAWHYQFTRETLTYRDLSQLRRIPPEERPAWLAEFMSRYGNLPVVVAFPRKEHVSLDRILGPGCRVIEQRFPRHVYVVISPEYTDDEESKPSVPGPTHLPPPDKP